MAGLLLWCGVSIFVAAHAGTVRNCHPGCHCEVESYGRFDSFSLTRVECRGLDPTTTMPIPIPLDTTHLDLSSNTMGPLTETMLSGPGYTTLVSLDLSSNHITKVTPNALSRLRYLETLDLSHNSLESLSHDCFSGLPLAEVDLSHNRLQEFDMDVFATKVHGKPISVDLSQNQLKKVFRGTNGGVLHVLSLVLAGNLLTTIPELAGVPLRDLSLDNNPISRIEEGSFRHLKDLVRLSLSGFHDLQEVQPNSFMGLQSLVVLDLSNNPRLKTLSLEVFTGLNSLQELILSNSGVMSLPSYIVNHLPSIRTFSLGGDINCWRTQKQGQFHWQQEQATHYEVLTCNAEGVLL